MTAAIIGLILLAFGVGWLQGRVSAEGLSA